LVVDRGGSVRRRLLLLVLVLASQDSVGGTLCLTGCGDDHLAIALEDAEPAVEVGSMVLHVDLDPSLAAEEGSCHLRDKLFLAVVRRAERRRADQ
jgi:hypothetical protein